MKYYRMLFILLLALCLTACGQAAAPAETPAPVASAEATPEADIPVAVETILPVPSLPDANLTEDDTPQENPLFQTALGYVDKPLEELKAAIGEPLSSSYVTSCFNPGVPGQDGELRYEGFTVITYTDGTTETVRDVIAD